VAGLKRGEETSVALAVDAMFPANALVAFAQEFSREHPAVALDLYTESLSAVTALVREKRVALGIAGEDADLSGLERRRVAELRLLPVAAPGYALVRPGSAPLDAAALARSVQIVLSARRAGEGEAPGADHGVFAARTWRVADLTAKHALIAGALGWGHMPEHLVRDDLRAGRLVELRLATWGSDVPRRALVLVRRRNAAMGPVARWVEARLTSLCRDALESARAAP
jgi:DNA-binding transcriptional LysR family regulator